MQTKQSVEEVGICLQRLAKKAFPGSTPKKWDRLLKSKCYQALLLKWHRKLSALKATEIFDDLYSRAQALERHDQQFYVRASKNKPQCSNTYKPFEKKTEFLSNIGPRRGP